MLKSDDNTFFRYEIIGEFQSDGEWLHPERTIDSYELIFVLSGNVYLEENNCFYEMSQNEILLLEPNKQHRGFKTSTTPTSFYWLHFYTDIPLTGKHYQGKEYHDIKYFLKKLLHISNTPSYSKTDSDTIALLVIQEFQRISNFSLQDTNTLLHKITEYIRINLQKNITIAHIASEFGYNAEYLGKLFRKHFHIGLKEYIATEKMKLAKDLLLSTTLSIKQIGYELGFSSENLFIKFFIYHEEQTPKQFRNRYYNTHINNH